MFDWLGLNETCRKAADVDVVGATSDELLDALSELAAIRALVDVAEARVLHRVDALGVTDIESGLGTAGWLSRETHVSRTVAHRRVRTATGLARLPETLRRLTEGVISADHAHVMAEAAANPRVGGEIPEIEHELLDLAEGTVFEAWRIQVQSVVRLLDVDGGHDPAGDGDARNRLRVSATGDATHLQGTVVGDTAETIRQVIETVTDELFRRYSRDRETCPELAVPNRATLRALALAEICRRARGHAPGHRAPVPDVTLVVNADDPQQGPMTSPDGIRLQDETFRTLRCDASWHAVVVDSLGVPLDMGREIRHPNHAQRRALHLRDGGCAFPGCDAHVNWTDAHHLDGWHGDHGHTDVHRMICLCRHHHRVVHRPGWTVNETPGGWYAITTPGGHTMWTQRHQRRRTGPEPGPG